MISASLNCGFAPKSECELTEVDGRNILETNVEAIDKNDSEFGGAATNNKNFRPCGYVSEEPTERGYLYWAQGKFEDEQEAKGMFEIPANRSSDKTNYSIGRVPGLGDETRLTR